MPNVAIIEDDEALASAMQASLITTGANVTLFDDAPAPEDLVRFKPDLLIVDCILQTTSGPDYLKLISSYDDLSKVPVIMTTGVGELADTMLESTGFRYTVLKKPFTMEALQRATEASLPN